MISLRRRFKCKNGLIAHFVLLVFYFTPSFALASEFASVCFTENCFYPEIARTQAEKQRGLMERVRLLQGQGMLFVYDEEARPAFWMKNMRMPLDFIWLDKQGKVVDVQENVRECQSLDCPTVESRFPAQYVLEVSAGDVQKLEVHLGDQATIKLGETL